MNWALHIIVHWFTRFNECYDPNIIVEVLCTEWPTWILMLAKSWSIQCTIQVMAFHCLTPRWCGESLHATALGFNSWLVDVCRFSCVPIRKLLSLTLLGMQRWIWLKLYLDIFERFVDCCLWTCFVMLTPIFHDIFRYLQNLVGPWLKILSFSRLPLQQTYKETLASSKIISSLQLTSGQPGCLDERSNGFCDYWHFRCFQRYFLLACHAFVHEAGSEEFDLSWKAESSTKSKNPGNDTPTCFFLGVFVCVCVCVCAFEHASVSCTCRTCIPWGRPFACRLSVDGLDAGIGREDIQKRGMPVAGCSDNII